MLSCHRQDDESAATTYLKAQSGDEMRWVTVVLPPLQTPPGHHFFFLFIFLLVGRLGDRSIQTDSLVCMDRMSSSRHRRTFCYDIFLIDGFLIWVLYTGLYKHWVINDFCLYSWLHDIEIRDINGYVKNHSNTDYSKIAYVDAGQDHYSRYYCHTYFFLISLLWRSWIH